MPMPMGLSFTTKEELRKPGVLSLKKPIAPMLETETPFDPTPCDPTPCVVRRGAAGADLTTPAPKLQSTEFGAPIESSRP